MEVLLNSPTEDAIRQLATLDIIDPESENTVLNLVIENNDLDTLELMLRYGANTEFIGVSEDRNNLTALETAIYWHNVEAVRIILQYNPNVDDIDEYGVCCLAAAFLPAEDDADIEVSKTIAELLIAAGADLNSINNQGENILGMIFYDEPHHDNIEFVGEALRFFVSRGVDINHMNGHNTLLTNAFRNDSLAYVNLLVQLGATADQNLTMTWFIYATREPRLYFRKFISVAFHVYHVSDEMMYFLLRKMQPIRTEDELIANYEYLKQLITANYIQFIPDVNLYPLYRRRIIETVIQINSITVTQLSYLPIEVVFRIFSHMLEE